MKNILIMGMSPDRVEAYKNREEYELILGLPWDGDWARFDVLFEMHDRKLWERRGESYLERLRDAPQPIYMQQAWEDIPTSTGFTFLNKPQAWYYNSSIAYMMAHAIMARPARIDIAGVALRDTEEYAYQRPNMEHLIGYAEGMGIKVEILGDSCLKEFCPNILFLDELQTYKERYGYL